MKKIEMVDLKNQYLTIKHEIDSAIFEVIDSCEFVKGSKVKEFESHLCQYLNVKHSISCGNGTDALQIALMSLGLNSGDEVITTLFTFIATVEVIALLNLVPKFVDVDPNTFNIDVEQLNKVITKNTKVILPVHLFGQPANMESIIEIANQNKLFIIEDAAQAIGARYTFTNGNKAAICSMGTIACTSFFPSKNLGCFGDGGAIFTNDDQLAEKIRIIANHGMKKRYFHDLVGINSRLDTIQAAILDVKLRYLNSYIEKRKIAASIYDKKLSKIQQVQIPKVIYDHVYHQYTLIIKDGNRDGLKMHLENEKIPCMIYYPVPIHLQKAFSFLGYKEGDFINAEFLSKNVLSLPMHTELSLVQQEYICNSINSFYN